MGSGKQISQDSPQEDAGVSSRALRQAIGCYPDGKDVSGVGEGRQGHEKVPEMAVWGPLGIQCAHWSWHPLSGTNIQRVKYRVKGSKSHTAWCLGPSWDGSWPRPLMRREAGACGGSEQAEGVPQKSVKESRGSHEEAGDYKGEVLMHPKPDSHACLLGTKVDLALHPV